MITSRQNTLVKRVAGLKESRQRRREGVFVIEGERELLRAMEGGIDFETILYCADLMAGNDVLREEALLEEQFGGTRMEAVSEYVFERLAYRKQGGVVAVAVMPKIKVEAWRLGESPLVLVVEGVEKPGNLGALLRTADGAGVDAVIITDAEVDVYHPNVVRASLGALFTVRVGMMDITEARGWLRERQMQVIVAMPGAGEIYTQVDYMEGTAMVLGSEAAGVKQEWIESGARAVRIPMLGKMDSLNVSCSGAVLMYEALRQREGR